MRPVVTSEWAVSVVEVSVVIPCHNGARTLDDQLAALAAQSGAPAFEVVVVDNRSTDDSVRVAERWVGRIPHLRVVQAPDRAGAGYARNVGAASAHGATLLFCDSDDVVSDTWVADMVTGLGEVDVASGWLSFDMLNPSHLRTGRVEKELPRPFGYLPTISGGNLGMRKESFVALGGMDESMPMDEDVDLAWRAAEAGLTVGCVAALVHYRQRHAPAAVYRQFRGYASASILLWERYRDRPLRPIGLRGSALQLVRQLARVPSVLRGPRARWEYARDLGSAVGAVRGHLKYRFLGSIPPVRLMEVVRHGGDS